ncbi:oxidative damage protection protein [Thorsellia kenyensis]|uniref:Probable Fe(2+)-trafficking protein n=1 Tax=Thorsellia kenyensis TaxID=1549888 RepID=A0ABV6CDE4_9GAMM
MSRTVFCAYLKKEAEGLSFQFYPGELGKKVFNEISVEAWNLWLKKQTMLINENRLIMTNPEHRKLIETAMIDFLFNGKEIEIEGYKPES